MAIQKNIETFCKALQMSYYCVNEYYPSKAIQHLTNDSIREVDIIVSGYQEFQINDSIVQIEYGYELKDINKFLLSHYVDITDISGIKTDFDKIIQKLKYIETDNFLGINDTKYPRYYINSIMDYIHRITI